MVVLASDTITPPLLPRSIHMRHANLHPVSSSSSRSLHSVTTTTNNNKHNMTNNWSTRTKIIFAACCVAAILVVFAVALLLQCRQRRRRARAMTSPRDRSSALAIAENQGHGGFRPGLVSRLTDQMGGNKDRDGDENEVRFSEQSGGGMYHYNAGTRRGDHLAPSEKFETVPLGGPAAAGGGGGHGQLGGAAPTRPGGIYRYGDRQSRFSP